MSGIQYDCDRCSKTDLNLVYRIDHPLDLRNESFPPANQSLCEPCYRKYKAKCKELLQSLSRIVNNNGNKETARK